VAGQLRGAAFVRGDLFLNVLRVQKMQALGEAGVLAAFAFAGTGAVRTAEDLEEVTAGVVAVVRQRDGARASRLPFEPRLAARHGVDGVEEHFGGQTFGVVTGEIPL